MRLVDFFAQKDLLTYFGTILINLTYVLRNGRFQKFERRNGK